MYTDEYNDLHQKKLLPLSPSPVTPVLLVAEQLLNLRL